MAAAGRQLRSVQLHHNIDASATLLVGAATAATPSSPLPAPSKPRSVAGKAGSGGGGPRSGGSSGRRRLPPGPRSGAGEAGSGGFRGRRSEGEARSALKLRRRGWPSSLARLSACGAVARHHGELCGHTGSPASRRAGTPEAAYSEACARSMRRSARGAGGPAAWRRGATRQSGRGDAPILRHAPPPRVTEVD